MRSISHRKNPPIQTIFAAAAAAFLLIAFAPDARAADSGAKAQDPKWYFSLSVPVMFIDDSDSVEKGAVPSPAGKTDYTAKALTEYATGYRVSGALGREFGNGLRVDGEVFLASAKVDKLIYKGRTTTFPTQQGPMTIDVPGESSIPVSGSASQMGAMVNVWYDFNTGSKWTPYVGFGLGFLRVDWGDVKYDRNEVAQGAADQIARLQCKALPPGVQQDQCLQGVQAGAAKLPPGTVPELSDTDTVLAYQLGLGLAYEYSDAITFQVGYRLSRSGDLEFSGKNTMTMATATATTDMQVHLFELGIRYRF